MVVGTKESEIARELRHNVLAKFRVCTDALTAVTSSCSVYFVRQWGVSIHLHFRAMRLKSKGLQTPRSKIVGMYR